ncbi:pickpocket protein 28-like [Plutella xylostella]|uniref:pickpocket protein 28-like n=1 Tax=Plutella xylostella TaxID=51655 RepID=UPI002032850B|nr:pickpocket protein 28-like [Plutella xylostella]
MSAVLTISLIEQWQLAWLDDTPDLQGAEPPDHDYSFEIVLTEEGLCYTYNTLSQDEILKKASVQTEYEYLTSTQHSCGWTMEEGYEGGRLFNETYPLRGAKTGKYNLMIAMQSFLTDHDEMCNPYGSGFKIFLHHPADLPHSSAYSYAALPGQLSSLALTFHSTTTSHNLRKYHPEVRQCYFQNERFLRYFHIYTQNNCMLECRANYTFHRCQCVPFYLPYKNSDSICTASDLFCITEAIKHLGEREMRASLGLESEACRCLPACNSVTYEAEILKTEYNIKNSLKNYARLHNESFGNEYDNDEFSVFEVYYKQERFPSIRRSELFGVTDVVANCGGLLGLFLGFSFLSIVEIVYFTTLRLFCQIRRRRQLAKEKK